MANLNLELGTIALPILIFLFTKSLKQSITERLTADRGLSKSVLFSLDKLDNQTIQEISTTLKGIFYEIEMNRINFCDKYNGKQLTKADWASIRKECMNGTLHFVLPAQLIPIWYKCINLDKFCSHVEWVQMKGCLIESLFEQKIQHIQVWYRDRLVNVLENLTKMKSCIVFRIYILNRSLIFVVDFYAVRNNRNIIEHL